MNSILLTDSEKLVEIIQLQPCMFICESAILKMDVKKTLKVISLFGHFSRYIVELVLKKNEITNCSN